MVSTLTLVLVSVFMLVILVFVSGVMERPGIAIPSFLAGFITALLVVKVARR